jgi:hypothetical protein
MLKIPLLATLAVLICHPSAADEWHFCTVDSVGDVGSYSSLAVCDGRPAIAYHDATNGDLKYAWRADDMGWHFETVDASTWTGEQVSLAFSSEGKPGISYVDPQASAVMYAYKDAEGWHKDIVDSNGYSGFNTSLAFNDQQPVMVYGQVAGGLAYAYKDESGWHTDVIDELVSFGWCSLAFSDGEPAIAYNDTDPCGGGGLKYAYMNGGYWNY